MKNYATHGTNHHPLGSDPTVAIYAIKVSQDAVELTTADTFEFRIPARLNGWRLTDAWGYVTAVSTSGDVEVRIEVETVNVLSTPITIVEDDDCGSGVIDRDEDQVETCDLVKVVVENSGADAEGLGVELEFSPGRLL